MKNLDEYSKETLLELQDDIEALLDNPVDKRKKRENLQYLSDLHDRMKKYNEICGERIYNIKYGK